MGGTYAGNAVACAAAAAASASSASEDDDDDEFREERDELGEGLRDAAGAIDPDAWNASTALQKRCGSAQSRVTPQRRACKGARAGADRPARGRRGAAAVARSSHEATEHERRGRHERG